MAIESLIYNIKIRTGKPVIYKIAKLDCGCQVPAGLENTLAQRRWFPTASKA
jgi:hypothetical protein